MNYFIPATSQKQVASTQQSSVVSGVKSTQSTTTSVSVKDKPESSAVINTSLLRQSSHAGLSERDKLEVGVCYMCPCVCYMHMCVCYMCCLYMMVGVCYI